MNINNFPISLNSKTEIPEFLIKTTLYCSFIAALFISTFIILDWSENHQFLVILLSIMLGFCLINIWFGLHNKYSLFLNTYIFLPATFFVFSLTLNIRGEGASYWIFMLVLACYFILPSKRAVLFNILLLFIFIPHAYYIMETDSALRFSVALLGQSLLVFFGMAEIEKLNSLLKVQAFTDPLTGLFNRSLLDDSLSQSINQSHRSGLPMTLISLDIDHFKQINDSLGHDIGDVVLKRLGELLLNRIRSADRMFRVGGEEFLILLHNTNLKQAVKIAEELRLQIETHQFIPLQNVTVSIGVAELGKEMSSAEWLKQADIKLYQAKEAGRNCVVS